MQQKYSLFVEKDKKRLVIQEFATVDKDVMAFLNEESYDLTEAKKAAKNGVEYLMEWLRTDNFFPPDFFMVGIAEKAKIALEKGKEEEISFDDADYISMQPIPEPEKEAEEETELDEILDEEIDEDFEDDKALLDIDVITLDEEE